MALDLKHELRQTRPFRSVRQEAYLNVVRTATLLADHLELALRPYGLSSPQYNVLRILRGAEPEGLCRNALRDRLLTRMPDVTRLLDRMEEAGLVTRARDAADRRLVTTRPTKKALRLLARLDAVIDAEHERRLAALDERELRTLVALLTRLRQPAAGTARSAASTSRSRTPR